VSRSTGAEYSSKMPVLFQENATSLPSGETSIPPKIQSTYGEPTRSSIARRRNF